MLHASSLLFLFLHTIFSTCTIARHITFLNNVYIFRSHIKKVNSLEAYYIENVGCQMSSKFISDEASVYEIQSPFFPLFLQYFLIDDHIFCGSCLLNVTCRNSSIFLRIYSIKTNLIKYPMIVLAFSLP